LVLAACVVVIRREARVDTITAAECVRRVPGVLVKAAGNPSRVVIEPRVGDTLIVEPEIPHKRLL